MAMARSMIVALGMLIATSGAWASLSASAGQEPEVRVVSSRPDAVSGGTALVQLDTPGHSDWAVLLDGRDITLSFRRSERTGKLLALVNSLRIGKNTLEVRLATESLNTLDNDCNETVSAETAPMVRKHFIGQCALKPVDPSDYSRPLTPDQLERLESVFPAGVCDYSQSRVGQQPTTATWQRY